MCLAAANLEARGVMRSHLTASTRARQHRHSPPSRGGTKTGRALKARSSVMSAFTGFQLLHHNSGVSGCWMQTAAAAAGAAQLNWKLRSWIVAQF